MSEEPPGAPRAILRDLRGNACLDMAPEFCRRHGLDWQDFKRRGIPVADLLALGDENATRVARAALARIAAAAPDGDA